MFHYFHLSYMLVLDLLFLCVCKLQTLHNAAADGEPVIKAMRPDSLAYIMS